LRLPSSGSHVGVPAGDDVVNVKRNFGVAVDGGDAEAATGGFDEAGEGGEVKVLAALQLGEVALFHTQGLSELLLGQAHGTTDFAECGALQAEAPGDLLAKGPVGGDGLGVAEQPLAGGADSLGGGAVYVPERRGERRARRME
jgi:hypothetical protein